MWNLKWYLWNSTQNILPIHWKMQFLYSFEILRAHKGFWPPPPPPPPPWWHLRQNIGSLLVQMNSDVHVVHTSCALESLSSLTIYRPQLTLRKKGIKKEQKWGQPLSWLVIDMATLHQFTITSTSYTVLPLFAARFAARTGGIWVTFIEPDLI